MSNGGKVTTQIEVQGAQKGAADLRNLRDELQKYAQATQRVFSLQRLPPIIRQQTGGGSGGAQPPRRGGIFGSFGEALGFGTGAGAGFAAFMTAVRLFEKAVQAFMAVVMKIKEAFQEGFQLYNKGAQAGLAPGKIFALEQAAGITGMDPKAMQEMIMRTQAGNQGRNLASFKDRARFSGLRAEAQEALDYFRPFEEQIDHLAGVARNAWGAVQKLNGDLRIFWLTIAGSLSGAVKQLAEQFSSLLRQLNETGAVLAVAEALGAALILVSKGFELAKLSIDTLSQALINFFSSIFDILAKLPAVGKFFKNVIAPVSEDEKASLKKRWASFFTEGWNSSATPMQGNRTPPTSLYIPPAGQWERLGLSFGSVDSDPAKQTAKNTAEMVALLRSMAGKVDAGRPYDHNQFANYA